MTLPLKNNNTKQAVDVIWNALHLYSEVAIYFDPEEWDEICTAMAWIQEALGCEEVMDD